jgi:hypothetical protein
MRTNLGLAVVVLAASCSVSPGGGPSTTPAASIAGVTVEGKVVAGPSCPVVTEPPQPGCADRPVSGAVVLVLDADGTRAARLVSDARGAVNVALAPGRYRLVPQPVAGLMGTAPEQELTVRRGEAVDDLVIAYDTGIR